jgi:hypothetical protein
MSLAALNTIAGVVRLTEPTLSSAPQTLGDQFSVRGWSFAAQGQTSDTADDIHVTPHFGLVFFETRKSEAKPVLLGPGARRCLNG